jgi:hypothetical protein
MPAEEEKRIASATALGEWEAEVASHMPHLSKPQIAGLAAWSFGIVILRACGATTISAFIAELLGQREAAVRQRLREWYWDAQSKKTSALSPHRRELVVTTQFVFLLRWILSLWPPTSKRIVLALDATALGARWAVLAISVVYQGCAIPVAWVILPAEQKGGWKPHWLSLLSLLDGAVPPDWYVVVMADRGLYARWLFRAICANHWHPFLRINALGLYRRQGHARWFSLAYLLTEPGHTWSGEVTCFKGCPVVGTLLAAWTPEHADPWLVLTDIAPSQARVAWYGMRTWIEAGFKDLKRGGWQWQHTRMTDADRVARFWLALAVATLWAVAVGDEGDPTLPVNSWSVVSATHISRRRPRSQLHTRQLSYFRRGCLKILVALLKGQPLPLGRFVPQPWPTLPDLVNVQFDEDELCEIENLPL